MKPKFFLLRSKKDADEFFEYAQKEGTLLSSDSRMPKEIENQVVKCEMRLGKKEKKRYLISTLERSNPPKFFKAHPSWIHFTYYYDAPLEDF